MWNTLALIIPLLIYTAGAFALFWIVRLGVRYGLRDHSQWTKATGTPPE